MRAYPNANASHRFVRPEPWLDCPVNEYLDRGPRKRSANRTYKLFKLQPQRRLVFHCIGGVIGLIAGIFALFRSSFALSLHLLCDKWWMYERERREKWNNERILVRDAEGSPRSANWRNNVFPRRSFARCVRVRNALITHRETARGAPGSRVRVDVCVPGAASRPNTHIRNFSPTDSISASFPSSSFPPFSPSRPVPRSENNARDPTRINRFLRDITFIPSAPSRPAPRPETATDRSRLEAWTRGWSYVTFPSRLAKLIRSFFCDHRPFHSRFIDSGKLSELPQWFPLFPVPVSIVIRYRIRSYLADADCPFFLVPTSQFRTVKSRPEVWNFCIIEELRIMLI